MKNIKINIILGVIFLSAVAFIGIANADSPSLYVSPSDLSKNAGSVFNASVGVNVQSNKVCVIEGTLVFNNLTCQNITLDSGVIAQVSPTCNNPYYLIGIPSCAVANKELLTVSVKAGVAGTASISHSGVDIIGEGVSIGSSSVGSNYTINSVPVVVSNPEVTSTEEITSPEPVQNLEEKTTPINSEQASLVSTGFDFSNYLWIGLTILSTIIVGIFFIKKTKKQN
ncbi:MAG: hypothetical protein WC511_07825 [Candidatus Pacearchaeota archaeon]